MPKRNKKSYCERAFLECLSLPLPTLKFVSNGFFFFAIKKYDVYNIIAHSISKHLEIIEKDMLVLNATTLSSFK